MGVYKMFSDELSNVATTESRGDVMTQTMPADAFPYARISVIKGNTRLFIMEKQGAAPYIRNLSALNEQELADEVVKLKKTFA